MKDKTTESKEEIAWRKKMAEATKKIKALAKAQIELMNIVRNTPPSRKWRCRGQLTAS